MKVVIQRVSSASVRVQGKIAGQIGPGLLVLAGFEDSDTAEDLQWTSAKIVNLRVFADGAGVMNVSLLDSAGDLLVVSQFTLHALTKKGNRPSYIRAAPPEIAIPLYERFLSECEALMHKPVQAGIF